MGHILIDMIKYREYLTGGSNRNIPEGIVPGSPETGGLKPLRELAAFLLACRRCSDAPCIAVCPQEALKKNEDDFIVRSTNLCVACKSCVVICPFGTMMSDFYEYKRTESLYFNLKDTKERERFINKSPAGTVSETEEKADEEHNIFELVPGIMIKDHTWDEIKKPE